MPRNDLISYKNDPDAIFAAQFMWLATHANAEDKAITDNFAKYRIAVSNRIKKLEKDNPDSREYLLLDQIDKETENLNQLILHYAMNYGKDERLTRDILIDATKSIKRLQGLQENLHNAGFGLMVMGDSVNGSWGSPKYVQAYVETMRRCNEGKELISQKYDENNPQVVADYDEVIKTPTYDHLAYKYNKVTHNKTYLMSEADFENYMASRRPAQAVQVDVDPAAPVDLDGSLPAKNGRDNSYTIDKNRIEIIQKGAKEILINTCINSTKKDTHGLYKDLCNLRDDLLKFHYDVKHNNVQANDTIIYLDGLLSDRDITIKNDKYKLQMNLKNPEPTKFLDNLVYFISDLESQKKKVDEAREPDADWYEKFFANGDGDSFKGILSELKKIQNDPKVPDTFKATCKPIVNKLESLAKRAFDNIDVEGLDSFEKYVAMNTGDFNFGKGQSAVDGVAKVTAAYEWKKKDVRNADPNKEAFDPKEVDKQAEEMKDNPIFKTYYKGRGEEKWSEVFLNSNAKNSKEWMVNNLIDNPFASTRRDLKLTAIKKLQELGKVLPSPKGGSSDYHRFNSLLKGLSEKDASNLSDAQMNYILKNVFDENEKYMKGRKSARFKDASKEHFEETLDVLKIYSDMDEYGKAMAKKLVDRTNYVRTHRWHHLSEQDKVTLEGRNLEATKARIDVLINGKKPAAKNEPKM